MKSFVEVVMDVDTKAFKSLKASSAGRFFNLERKMHEALCGLDDRFLAWL